MDVSRTSTVRAAGGIVHRHSPGGPEVLLVHRPRYDDWSLPKGKGDPGERNEETALREVEEETGLHCELGTELGFASYRDPKNRPKTVRYWQMNVTSGEFIPNNEVSELKWLELGEAAEQLSYDRDREILGRV